MSPPSEIGVEAEHMAIAMAIANVTRPKTASSNMSLAVKPPFGFSVALGLPVVALLAI